MSYQATWGTNISGVLGASGQSRRLEEGSGKNYKLSSRMLLTHR